MYKKNIILIILFLVIAASFVFRVGFNTDTLTVSRYFVAQVGSAIGVSVNIMPNPFNTLAQQLAEKEEELLQRETLLLAEQEGKTQGGIVLYLSLAIGAVLLFLILLNFYLDYRKRNRI